jgi:pimeloyl-ACP methyl ester carboxylesterase
MSKALDDFRAAPVHEIDLSGTTLRYRMFGDGPAVLLIHGWPLSGVTYRHLSEALSPQFRCYVPDLPGAGATPWSPSITNTIHGYTALMRAFVDRLQLETLAIVGHDSGGGVARLLAAELPGRVTSLVLQNTEVPNHIPLMVRLLKLGAASGSFAALLGRLIKSKHFRTSALGFGNCFGNRALIEGEFYEACVRPLEKDLAGQTAALAHLPLDWTRVLPEIHARIDAPIHLFWGEKDDDFFPLDRARAMAQQFRVPGEFQVIPGAKLYVHEEAHEELSRFALQLIAAGFANRAQRFDRQRQRSAS